MNIYFQKTHQRSFGTYPLKGDELTSALRHATKVGYRAIDTAQMYENEADVGVALRSLDIPRSELCVTTKVHPDNYTEHKFIPSVRASLKKLKLDHVDVLLLHWPPADGNVGPSLRRLEKAAKLGLAKFIGVSNYTSVMMLTAQAAIKTKLVTNQVEFHPLLDQRALLFAAGQTGIPLSSYCSVARGEIFKYPLFAEIGSAYGKTPAQVALRWILQKGVSINTMSTKPDNISANFDLMDFTLSHVHMDRIDELRRTNYRIVDRSIVPWAPIWD